MTTHSNIPYLWLLLAAGASYFCTSAHAAATPFAPGSTVATCHAPASTPTHTASRSQQNDELTTRITEWLAAYPMACATPHEKCKLESIAIDDENRVLRIFTNATFGTQPLTQQSVKDIYEQLRQLLPSDLRDYRTMLFSKRILIDELVPQGQGSEDEAPRQWHDTAHKGNPWVTPMDRPYPISEGLDGRHISLWASHGRYFSQQDNKWMWQRPSLFCTTEDLFSQTFVVPLLIPMLENAGAVVFTPRERDWQRHEAIVDNDTPQQSGQYVESAGQHPWMNGGTGFAHLKDLYTEFDNPFADGTLRMAEAVPRRARPSVAKWTPDIPADGRYAVYVSYATLPTSVPDATYIICHRGVETRIRVNQQMGGGTWVYLGSFDFAANDPTYNYVSLNNHSNYRGHVTADGVRFGGGMGNIARGDSVSLATSGLPRCLEGARYAAQWAGMPAWVYAGKGGINDYAEDINVRSYMTNYLAGGSAYVPADSGLNVPIELSLALHTDAGFTTDASNIGSLGIYTTEHNEGLLRAGMSRLSSRDLADAVLTQLNHDITATYGTWTRRQLWDRNYSETREPEVPSAIIEMLSHQNFADMARAHDPMFKFITARAIYKAVLRFMHSAHGDRDAVVQPLPVTAPMAVVTQRGGNGTQIRLSWQPTTDPLEPSAKPTDYVVYHAIGAGDFDNGTLTDRPTFRIDDPERGVQHRFRITAVNAGGQSLPSQEVCAFVAKGNGSNVLIVDAFDRLAGPQLLNSAEAQGFDIDTDPGVPLGRMPAYCGRQRFFNPQTAQREGAGAFGFSGTELEGIIVAGNTLDWSSRHAADIIRATKGTVNISSCTAAAVADDGFDTRQYALMDIVFGLDRADGYSLRQAKVFNESLRQAVAEFTRGGGNVITTGAYVATDMRSNDERLFTREVLKYEFAGSLPTDSIASIDGMGLKTHVYHHLNEEAYSVTSVDCLAPAATPKAFCAMTFAPSSQSAAVAYQGTDYRAITLGFPIEAVADEAARIQLWMSLLQFLLP